MYCQKCRTPLKLDSSLEDLNPAAYDLLIATASQPPHRKQQQQQQQPQQPLQSPTRPPNAPDADRRALYDQVSKYAGPPVFKRHGSSSGSGGSGGSMRDSSAMSFVLLSDSTLVTGPSHGPGGIGVRAALAYDGGVGGTRLDEDVAAAPGQTAKTNTTTPASAPVHGSAPAPATASAQGMERMTKLFEILSARSDVDHPVCVECTELLVAGLQQRLEAATRERDAYVSFLKTAQAEAPTAAERAAQAAALAQAREQEAAALETLRQLERDKAQLDAEVGALEAEARALDSDEEQFWRERNAFAARLADFQDARDSVNARYDHDARRLERLQRANVYNDTFCISHDGLFATINGLRLGRLAARPVDWPEINAAWGHALLLLVTVADKLRFRFENYEPLPMGSTSRIVRYELPSPASSRLAGGGGGGFGVAGTGAAFGAASLLSQRLAAAPSAPKKHVLELYSSGDMPLGLTFMHRRFDNAMVAFLELVRQLGVFVQQQTAVNGQHPLSLPYRIEGDKIGDKMGDYSIKLGIAQDDSWTKACKLTLTCCKFLLAHASNINAASGRGA